MLTDESTNGFRGKKHNKYGNDHGSVHDPDLIHHSYGCGNGVDWKNQIQNDNFPQ